MVDDKMDWLYKLKLHEIYFSDNNSFYRRVPGGWTYSDTSGVCFIPFNKEFMTLPSDNEITNEGKSK